MACTLAMFGHALGCADHPVPELGRRTPLDIAPIPP
jgi:hypothetical protein